MLKAANPNVHFDSAVVLIDVELLHENRAETTWLADWLAAGKTTTAWCYKSPALFKSAKAVENASSGGQTRK